MPGLSKFTVSKFAVSTFFNSVSKIQTLDTKNAWMLLTSSSSNTKEDKFEHIPSEARQLRNRNLTVLWRTCKSRDINKVRTMLCFLFSIGSSLVKIYLPRFEGNCNFIRSNRPYRPMTASSLRGWSQSDDSCVTLLPYKKSKEEISFSTSQWSRPSMSLPHWRSVL